MRETNSIPTLPSLVVENNSCTFTATYVITTNPAAASAYISIVASTGVMTITAPTTATTFTVAVDVTNTVVPTVKPPTLTF